MTFVTWRISSRRFAKWHMTVERNYTVCGQEIPPTPQYVDSTAHRANASDVCRTCVQHYHGNEAA